MQEATKTKCHIGSKKEVRAVKDATSTYCRDNELEFWRKLLEATRGGIFVMVSVQGDKLEGSHEDCLKLCQVKDLSVLKERCQLLA